MNMEYENKNKRKVHITPKDFDEYYNKMENADVFERAKHMSVLFGDCFVIHISKDDYLKALCDDSVNAANTDESVKADIDRICTSMTIHKDGVESLRGMTVAHAYIDDFYYNLPEPTEIDTISIIQSVDYDKLKNVLDESRRYRKRHRK